MRNYRKCHQLVANNVRPKNNFETTAQKMVDYRTLPTFHSNLLESCCSEKNGEGAFLPLNIHKLINKNTRSAMCRLNLLRLKTEQKQTTLAEAQRRLHQPRQSLNHQLTWYRLQIPMPRGQHEQRPHLHQLVGTSLQVSDVLNLKHFISQRRPSRELQISRCGSHRKLPTWRRGRDPESSDRFPN